ncbi:hypothetical protein SGGMMB4_03684 [Sodalis glossinidius str. 'morsitans']|uniref:Uncharacterized protein n=1 Tax=Sodalis glossinidius (strain morsitans) TaxID=343509 RepID=A0A193QKJ1_SODGM|nr:hypothetical protein [Sodalis glossinidius]CRL45692.1 hypothetical protein SGGMMB4_03684 [Sodalis glossinidius str. 'morsitans']
MSNHWLSKWVALAAAAVWMGSLCALAVAAPAPVKVTFVQEWPVADGFWIPWRLGISKGFYREEGIDLNVVVPPTVRADNEIPRYRPGGCRFYHRYGHYFRQRAGRADDFDRSLWHWQ